jgi:hypothetical protein
MEEFEAYRGVQGLVDVHVHAPEEQGGNGGVSSIDHSFASILGEMGRLGMGGREAKVRKLM